MKIPSQAPPRLATPISPSGPVRREKTESAGKGSNRKATNTSSTQHRINHWFSSIGVDQANLEYRGFAPQRLDQTKRIREQKKFNNLQKIMGIALGVSLGEQTQEQIDPDWFHSFISMAENIYSPAMQELWGKIFAVEVQRPGSFSLRSLETLTKLTQRDARLFTQACQLACRRNNDPSPIIITGYHQQPGLFNSLFTSPSGQTQPSQFGISYTDILALGSMKLIYATEIETGLLNKETTLTLKFANDSMTLAPKHRQLLISYYKFTSVGSELARLLPRKSSDGFIQHIKQTFNPHFSVT